MSTFEQVGDWDWVDCDARVGEFSDGSVSLWVRQELSSLSSSYIQR